MPDTLHFPMVYITIFQKIASLPFLNLKCPKKKNYSYFHSILYDLYFSIKMQYYFKSVVSNILNFSSKGNMLSIHDKDIFLN